MSRSKRPDARERILFVAHSPLRERGKHFSSGTEGSDIEACKGREWKGERGRGGGANRLTVRLLVACAGTGSAELLRLAATRVRNEEGSVVLHQNVLNLVLRRLVDVLLVVGDKGLGDGLADGVDLCRLTSTLDADANVHNTEFVLAHKEDRLEALEAHGLGLEEIDGHSVHLDDPAAGFAVCHGGGVALASEYLH